MSYKVLICDDEAIIRQGIHKILKMTYEQIQIVAECKNGDECYKQIVIHNPDLVITDIRMPLMNGLNLVKLCSNMEKKPKFIIISAYSEFEYARTAMKYGVSEYLVKPINRFELIQAVNQMLRISPSNIREKAETFDSNKSKVIEKAIYYINQNFYKNISLEDVSQMVGVNPNYFSTLFKKQLGMNYLEYLTKLRMDKAQNLLSSTELKISDIATMIGYLSSKHFTRIYKEHFGVTPSETRKK